MTMKLTSRVLRGENQHRRSVLCASKYYFRQNSRNKFKSLRKIDVKKRGKKFAECCLMIFIYVPLLFYGLFNSLWVPVTMPNGEMPTDIKKEVGERIYAERCSLYSSGHAFYSFITAQYAYGVVLILASYPFDLIALLRFRVPFQLIEVFGCILVILLCWVGSCVCIQPINAFTCRPFEILFDLRFISILTTQLLGLIGCLLFAYKLGSIFSIKVSKNISEEKNSFIPLSQSFVINLK